MSEYPHIPVSASVHHSIREVVRLHVEPILHDVRVMLSHPRAHGEPAFNLSAAIILASVIGGLSRVFFSSPKGDRANFVKVARRYPLADEPQHAVRDPDEFATELYKTYRCNLVHSLGLTVDDSGNRYEIVAPARTPKVLRWKEGISDEQLAALEQSTGRPPWLAPTMWFEAGVLKLSPDALYWGIRRLVRELAEDASLHASAIEFLKPWYATLTYIAASADGATMSSTAVRTSVSATLGSLSVGSVGFFGEPK